MTTGSYKEEWEDQLLSGSCSSVLGALDFQSLGLSSTPDRSLVFLILSSHPLTYVLRKFMYTSTTRSAKIFVHHIRCKSTCHGSSPDREVLPVDS